MSNIEQAYEAALNRRIGGIMPNNLHESNGIIHKQKSKLVKKRVNHKWSKGPWPNVCENCGIIRTRETVKYLMAITNKYPYNHYRWETKTVYQSTEKKYDKAPPCKLMNSVTNPADKK